MREHISPEEKLLRLIKGKAAKLKTTPQGTAVSTGSKQQPVTGSLKPGFGLSFKETLRSFEQIFFSRLGIRTVLWTSFILACVYLIFALLYPLFGLRAITLPKVDSRQTAEILPAAQKEKPFEYYAQAAAGKQIFGSATAVESTVAATRGSAELIKDFNLIGVVSGENPQAVIEDRKAQKSFTVTRGQFVGEFQVEDIQEGRVILSYQGQRFELSM